MRAIQNLLVLRLKMTPTAIRAIGSTRGWSQWTYPSQFQTQPNGAGEYMLRATSCGQPISIMRRNGADSQGILYIGETKRLESRFLLLVKSLQNAKRKTKHHAVKRYYGSAQLQTSYPLKGLQVRYKKENLPPLHAITTNQQRELSVLWPDPDGKARAVIGERSALFQYEAKFDELPVLNKKRGNKI